MNPFLAKPLKKVQGQGPPQFKNSSQEHRPSKYMNPPKNVKPSNAEKKAMNEIQKIRNQSPRDKNAKSNNINVINRFKEEDTNPKLEKVSESGLNNIKEENPVELKKANQIKQENTNSKFANNKKNNVNSNLKVETNINFLIPFDSSKLHFNNNDEVLEYLKNKIKEGSIKNIIQKLELKKNDFTGFTLSKKNLGYTIYEIEMEDDIEKINETIKKQRVEIKNKPIEIRYIGVGPLKKDKDNVVEEKKNATKNNDSLIQAMKKKTLERIEKNDAKKNEKVNNEIKNLQSKIGKQKEELKNAENEKDFMFKKSTAKSQNKLDSSSVDNRRQSGVKKGELKYSNTKKEEEEVVPDVLKKKISAEESQRKMSRAYVRFKKAFGNQKEDEKAGEKDRKAPEKSEKIASIAEILKEHIIKPLAEIQEENDLTKPRAGSVGIRQIKIDRGGGERKEEGVAQILQNIPVQKKNVKKPKIAAFVQ